MSFTPGKLREVVHGDRAAEIWETSPGLWTMSLDGIHADALYASEADAEEGAKRVLADPNCPMWLKPTVTL